MGESHLMLIINTVAVSNSPVHWPTYQLSKHLVSILSPIGNSSSKVWNSSDFADFINSQSLQSDETLVSFDVVSLFTNVPVDLAARVANKTLADCTGSSPDQVTDLLRFCLNATYLAYWGEFYKQTFGTAMGSPVSVTVADLVMEDVEQQALSTFPTLPRFWKRYVDDTCTALHPDQHPAFHHHLNSIEAFIQFTLEPDENGKLAFLHTVITHHPDGSLSTTVHRKATHTDKYLDFRSNHPLAHKIAVPRTLFSRARSLCTCVEDLDQEVSHGMKALKWNGYPKSAIKMSYPQRQ